MSSTTLKDVTEHFAFGQNWASYARLIDEPRMAKAREGLSQLVNPSDLRGRSFLDIGCGSGLHALAALQLGASSVVALDLDGDSVATTRRTLERFAPGAAWRAEEVSVFDLRPEAHGRFDVVYSWGVLHHTGAMHEAIARAAAMVAPGGRLVLALYRRTRLCGFWRAEKRLYARASPALQRALRAVYVGAHRVGFALTRRDFAAYVARYRETRGMDFEHDVHDWLGGYPYESISPRAAYDYLGTLGFAVERALVGDDGGGFRHGCDEYTFRRVG